MSISKCNGCGRIFASEHGLSTHFQHNKKCNSTHYEFVSNFQSSNFFNINAFSKNKELSPDKDWFASFKV